MNCFGSLIKIVLGIVNTIFLLFGIAVFVFAAILKWSSISFINKIVDNKDIESIIDVSVIKGVTIALMVIGGFIIVLSLVGLIGVCCESKIFLIVYDIIVGILFLSHGIVLIVAGIKSSDIEKEFRKALNNTVNDINKAKDPTDPVIVSKCKALNIISEIFECCGASGPNDFVDNIFRQECCKGAYSAGCSDKTVKAVKKNAINIIVIPNSVILGFEFLILIVVIFLIVQINKKKNMGFQPTTMYARNSQQVKIH